MRCMNCNLDLWMCNWVAAGRSAEGFQSVVVGSAGCGCTSHLYVNTGRGAVRGEESTVQRREQLLGIDRSCAPNSSRAKKHQSYVLIAAFGAWYVVAAAI